LDTKYMLAIAGYVFIPVAFTKVRLTVLPSG
jgi:hypothetical protein